MSNKKYHLLEDEFIELKLLTADDMPKDTMPPKWHVYICCLGTGKDSILGYAMQTLQGELVIDKLLVHIEVGKKNELTQQHINRSRDKIFVELERLGHIVRVHRIEALKYFDDATGRRIARGEKGGYVQRLSNLSQHDRCWIANDAIACQDATVCDDAMLADNAIITSGSVYEKATLNQNAEIHGGSLCGRAIVGGYTRLNAGDRICGDTIYKALAPTPPIIIRDDQTSKTPVLEAKVNQFCQFPFKLDRPKLQKRTPGEVSIHSID